MTQEQRNHIMQSKKFDAKTDELADKIAKNFEAWDFTERPADELLTELLYMAHVIVSDTRINAGEQGGNLFDTIATLTQVAREIEHSRIVAHFEEEREELMQFGITDEEEEEV